MAVRVTGEEVKEIFDTKLTDTQVEPFIEIANEYLNRALANAGHSEATMTKIELLYSAHLVCLRDPVYKSEKHGDATGTRFEKPGTGVMSTPYGQQAAVLDTSGILSSAGKKKASFTAIDLGL